MTPFSAAEIVRAGALYGPLLLAVTAGIVHRYRTPHPRRFAAALLAGLWMVPSLTLLQQLNLHAHWWAYTPGSPATLHGMPLELLLGWAILWGVLPALTLTELPIPASATLLVAIDLLLMPACRAAVVLGPHWLLGELVAVLLCLLPALLLARTTARQTHLRLRSTLQLVLAGGLFLYLVPSIAFVLRPGRGWQPILSPIPREIAAALVFLLALPGIAAVAEFARRGAGTPIPYDPPRQLVTSGIYRFVANPMQLSCTLAMLASAAVLRNSWLVIPAALAFIYSAGIARWDEREDLLRRFGRPWQQYREHVHDWLPRLTPHHAGPPAELFLAHETCVPCSQLHAWLLRQHPTGLLLLHAEATATRLTYRAGPGIPPEVGVRAFARALEHLNLGYALAGAALSLPGIAHVAQLVMDAAGFGPRALQSNPETQPESCPLTIQNG